MSAPQDIFGPRLATRLADARQRGDALAASLAELGAMRDANNDDEHDPDGSPVSAEWSKLAGQQLENRAEQAAIEAALARLERGEYGMCEGCGQPIPERRLAVRPMAATCVACAG